MVNAEPGVVVAVKEEHSEPDPEREPNHMNHRAIDRPDPRSPEAGPSPDVLVIEEEKDEYSDADSEFEEAFVAIFA